MSNDDQQKINEQVAIENIEYRLELIEAKLGIAEVYQDPDLAKMLLKNSSTCN